MGSRRQPGRERTRSKPREINESALARKAGVAVAPHEWRSAGDYREDPEVADNLRRELALGAKTLLAASPEEVRAFGSSRTEDVADAPRALDIWGQPGPLKGHDFSRSERAAAIVLGDVELRQRWERTRGVSRVMLGALKSAAAADSFVASYGVNKGMVDHLDQAGVPFGAETTGTGELVPDDFRKLAATNLKFAIADRNKDERRRLTAIHSRVVDTFVSPTAARSAEGLISSLPADDYRAGVRKIDWQVLYNEQDTRGALPNDAIRLVTGVIHETCTEVGIDYNQWNSIDVRTAEGLQPVMPPPADPWANRWRW